MKHIPPNGPRACLGIMSYFLVGIGAAVMWGFGGAMLTLGLLLAIDVSSDEIVERVTNTTRFPPSDKEGTTS
jgi:hypothetical protein